MKKLCKLTISILAIGLVGSSVFAKELTESELFSETIKHVDMGGLELKYSNTTNLSDMVLKVTSMLSQMPPKNPQEQMIYQMIPVVSGELVNYSGLKNIKAMASSYKSEQVNGKKVYNLRSFNYTGANPTGFLFDITSRQNSKFDLLAKTPANATMVMGGFFTPYAFWQGLKANLASNQQFAMFPAMLEVQVQQAAKIELHLLLGAISGEYFVALKANEQKDDFDMYISIPDKAGMVGTLLRKHIKGLKAGDAGTLVLELGDNKDIGIESILFRFSGNNIEIASSMEMLKACSTTSGMDTALAKDVMKMAPNGGLSYIAGSIPKEILAQTKSSKDLYICGISEINSTGYKSTVTADFDMIEVFSSEIFALMTKFNQLMAAQSAKMTK